MNLRPQGSTALGSLDNTSSVSAHRRSIERAPSTRHAHDHKVSESPPRPASTRVTASTSRTRSRCSATPACRAACWAIVADGMGGRSGGRKASDQVMLTAKQLFERYEPEHDDAPSHAASSWCEEAHIVIKLTAISSRAGAAQHAGRLPDQPGAATATGSMPAIRASTTSTTASWSSAPCDHSYVQTLVDRGEITEEEANVHPQSNILLGCLGTEARPAGRHPPHPAAAPGRRADGLQRRRVALLQPERDWARCCPRCRRAKRPNS